MFLKAIQSAVNAALISCCFFKSYFMSSPLLFAVVLDSKAIDSNQPMNALMRLNQIRPGLQYRLLSQSGPVHAPVFTMSVDVDGSNYEASGSSKKTAKLHVAVKVRWKSEKAMWRIACLCLLNQYLQPQRSIWNIQVTAPCSYKETDFWGS